MKTIPVDSSAKSHGNVADMLKDLLEDDVEFATELDDKLRQRQFVKALAIIRNRAGLSQQQLAEKMGCTQSKISKLESGLDADLKHGDVLGILKATGHEAKILLIRQNGNVSREVMHHLAQIQSTLERLVLLSGDDASTVNAAIKFTNGVEIAVKGMLSNVQAALIDAPSQLVQVETPESEPDAEITPPQPNPRRKLAKADH
ncbi:MAG: helix-turn-helix domain-containing protein [Fimbriiglobus sp.]